MAKKITGKPGDFASSKKASVKKEAVRQEKRKIRTESGEFEKKAASKEKYSSDRKPFVPKKREGEADKPYTPKKREGNNDKPFSRETRGKRVVGPNSPFAKGNKRDDSAKPSDKKSYGPKKYTDDKRTSPWYQGRNKSEPQDEKAPYPKRDSKQSYVKTGRYVDKNKPDPSKPRKLRPGEDAPFYQADKIPSKPGKKISKVEEPVKAETMPLNKFIAHCGICSRRDAVELIKKGKIKVNGLVEVEPATKVSEVDFIIYEDKRLFPQKKLVYYLLNKPKDYITTTDDPKDRKTVLDLFKAVAEYRIFPIGRLDRNTTGLLLLTNDGDLAQKLSHPKHNIKKVYQVMLDKPLNKNDFEAIAKGITLEDGLAEVDDLAFTNPSDKKEMGIQIHIGRNRIVRRIFEHLGYTVKALDRVVYAGLTKKNLPRGKWRELDTKEVIYLKHY